MNIINKIKKSVVLEIIKWFGVVALLIMSIVVNHMFCECDVFIRRMIILFIVSAAICVLLTTKSGKLLTIYGKESYIELQKVIWPTYRDVLNTTMIVIIVTMLISLVLWGLDTILVHLISFGLRL